MNSNSNSNSNSKLNLAAILAEARKKKESISANENNPVANNVANQVANPATATVSGVHISKESVPTTATTSLKEDTIPNKAASLAAKLAELRAQKEAAISAGANKAAINTLAAPVQVFVKEEIKEETKEEIAENTGITGMHGEYIAYNERQRAFINLAASGKDCILIGAAGTGKTTCSQGAIKALLTSGLVAPLSCHSHGHLVDGSPGILIISFTRRAVNNIRKVQPEDMKKNCITAHKLLEYEPVYFEIEDETGKIKKTMRFLPSRDQNNPLPESIHTIIVEEASMLSNELYAQILAALKHKVQWIFIGDIEQLPPVFGAAVLGYKLTELPCVQLTEVYRQALDSPIIKLAHRILSGKPIPAKEYESWKVKDKLTIHPWKKKLHPELATLTAAAFFKAAIDNKVYDPSEDMILIPYNKACGTIEINKHIANHLARKRNATTYEVIAGFVKHYLSEGDKVLFDREDAEIVSIEKNSLYAGARPQACSPFLDYWGYNSEYAAANSAANNYDDLDIDSFLAAASAESSDRTTQASHKITLRLMDTLQEVTIDKAADLNNLLLSYALTVHKSQGSEWRKVFFVLHQSHATMLQRELLYTGVTRAREELYVICEPESFTNGILSQRIKGNSLAEKANYFKGKMEKDFND